MTSGIAVFLVGVVVYGVILNMREVTLQKAMLDKGYRILKNPNIVIDRKSFQLSLYEDTVLIKSYRVSFGKNINEKKNRANDYATPVGEYQICSVDTLHQYHKFLRLNYPNLDDASEVLRLGLITQKEFDDLRFQYYYGGCTDYNEVLGGNIGIHGIGRLNYIFKNLPFVYNWTDGSVAMSNENIDEIFSITGVGTKVVIK
ncbi:MAG: L,D-transpeptidase [Ignavibacteriales bacterium]|nr:MAG: L,D-transpeptidase [Ignavibacteriales bacterium]